MNFGGLRRSAVGRVFTWDRSRCSLFFDKPAPTALVDYGFGDFDGIDRDAMPRTPLISGNLNFGSAHSPNGCAEQEANGE
jgi:hypothetical protein